MTGGRDGAERRAGEERTHPESSTGARGEESWVPAEGFRSSGSSFGNREIRSISPENGQLCEGTDHIPACFAVSHSSAQ